MSNKFAYFIGGPMDLTKMAIADINAYWHFPILVSSKPCGGHNTKIAKYHLEDIFDVKGNSVAIYLFEGMSE